MVVVAVACAVCIRAEGHPVVVACVVVAVCGLALLRRPRSAWVPVLASVAVLLAVTGRAHQDLDGLRRPTPPTLEGVAELGGDPEQGRYATRVEVVLDGRRWSAEVPRELESVVDRLRTGDRVRLRARTGKLPEQLSSWWRARHLVGRLTVERVEPEGTASPWFSWANALHERLAAGTRSFSDEHASLYLGLVVGDDRDQSDLTAHRFRVAGLTHLLAVSGQNVAFLFVVVAPLLVRLPLRWRWALGGVVILGFVVLTRAEPSVLRAAAMAGLVLGATSVGRAVSGVRVLATAVVVLLLSDPLLVWSAGFQLSVGATVGLVVLARPLARWIPGPRWLVDPLAVTLAAQAGALPVSTALFGPSSAVAVPANLLAEPAAAGVMTSGLTVGLLAGSVHERIAAPLQVPARLMVGWIDLVARGASQAAVPPLGPAGWMVLSVAVVGGIAVHRVGGANRRMWWLPALLVVVVLLRPVPVPATPTHAAGAAFGRDSCGRAQLRAVGGSLEVAVLEALWQQGHVRADVVVAGPGTRGAAATASQLRAALEVADDAVAGAPGDSGSRPTGGPSARGSPCRLAG